VSGVRFQVSGKRNTKPENRNLNTETSVTVICYLEFLVTPILQGQLLPLSDYPIKSQANIV